MILRYLYRLSAGRRTQRADRHLGYVLTFVAGAVNAGGFLAIGQYTSHMTGIVSSMADHLALGSFVAALSALVAWIAFVCGAATTAILVNLARRRHLRSHFALSLLFEAALLLTFGMAGAWLADIHDALAPVTVLLLCYIMGLQNAVITKASGAAIRTTHLTGMTTDLGIELGKLFYFNRRDLPQMAVRANRDKLGLHARLIGSFFIGGVTGALSFKHVGYGAAVFLAAILVLIAAGPILADMRVRWKHPVRKSTPKAEEAPAAN